MDARASFEWLADEAPPMKWLALLVFLGSHFELEQVVVRVRVCR
jgi:hypothetical protein